MSVVLSNRQLPMIEALHDVEYMKYEEAYYYDQRAFGSMWRRGYMAFKHGKGFYLTEKGKEARREFYSTDIARKNPRGPLTAYFDFRSYGLAPRKPLHVVKREQRNAQVA
jgi:predicted ATPase